MNSLSKNGKVQTPALEQCQRPRVAEDRWETIKHVTLIMHFISNLMPPLIWQHEPVSLAVGNACSRRPALLRRLRLGLLCRFPSGRRGGVLVCEAQARCSPPRGRCLAQRLLTGPSPSWVEAWWTALLRAHRAAVLCAAVPRWKLQLDLLLARPLHATHYRQENPVVVTVLSLSHVRLLWPPWIAARQAPLYMGFPRKEYQSELSFPSPGNIPNPGIKPTCPALAGRLLTTEPAGKPKWNSTKPQRRD